jgi:hypothetical protein
MNKLKLFVAKRFFKELFPQDASGSSGGSTGRELANQVLKRVVYKDNNDVDFEDPSFDLTSIQDAYNKDAYVRQGVDKYVDQIFKEGYQFYGTDTNTVDYLKQRLAFIAEATSTPTSQLLMDIAEDVVKYANCMVVKARSNDPNALPQGITVQGLYGKDPVCGYFCANATVTKCKRDDYGTVTSWQQETDKGKQEFNPEDVVHFYYKREKGNAYGTSFLVPVIPDVKALRRAEENVLKMMYRNVYPFYHIRVGTEEATGTSKEVEDIQTEAQDMDVEAMLVTTERVEIKPIASDKVIDAEPYLKYMESRVFSGLGIPEIMFGRGNCYDEQTQTLTDNGFKYWYEVTENDKIATFNPENDNIEYYKPNDDLMKFVNHYTGKMVHFRSKHMDIMVSPQHDMWVCTNGRIMGKMKWKKVKAIDLYNSNIKNFYFMEQTNGYINNCNDDETFTIPYVESKYTNGNNDILSFNIKAFVEFLGYFISEGSLNPSKAGKYCISITQKKKNILNKILSCIDKLNLQYNQRIDKRDGTVEITIYHKSLWMYLKDNFGLYDKDRHISREIINLSNQSLEILLNALIDGDGTRDKRKGRTSMSYYSSSEELLDDIQEICIKLGYKAKILYASKLCANSKLLVHRVMISNSRQKYRYCNNTMISLEDYDGIMYCYNIPNHLFITRRNGLIAIQGNTANRSTGDNMTSEMADRIRAMQRVIETFFNEFIVKELLMEGGYDPVLNPDQAVEFKFNDNDVDVEIKKQVHAIYKYEHNSITEDEMREEIGMDPIPDGDREKMFVELITRETLRVQSELDAQVAKATGTGTGETNNKEKNGGGASSKKSSKKDSINPASIGLIKDSIDVLYDDVDKYLAKCCNSHSEILQIVLKDYITSCSQEILLIISQDKTNTKRIENKLVKLVTDLLNGINTDLIGIDVYNSTNIIDLINIRIDIFKDLLVQYLME